MPLEEGAVPLVGDTGRSERTTTKASPAMIRKNPSVKGSSSAVKFWIAPTSKTMTTSQALCSAKRATADGMLSRQ